MDMMLPGTAKTSRCCSSAILAVMAEPEYATDRTLPKFAAEELGKDFRVSLVFGSQTDPADLPGLEALADADVLVVSEYDRRIIGRPWLTSL